MNGILEILQLVIAALTVICTLVLMVYSILVESFFKCASICAFAIMFIMSVCALVVTYREYIKVVRN